MAGCHSEDTESALCVWGTRGEAGTSEKEFLNFYILYGDSFQDFNSSPDGWEMAEETLE